MPNITVMSWNIQNFGQGTATYAQRKGPDSAYLANFIAHAVQNKGVDILGIMELMPANPRAHLDNLLIALANVTGDNSWCYDSIKGSVEDGVQQGEQYVTSPNDLTWRSGKNAPRREGYAVFWRNGSTDYEMLTARYPMSEGTFKLTGYNPGYIPGHALSLSVRGRETKKKTSTKRLRSGTQVTTVRPDDASSGFQPTNPAGWRWEDSLYLDAGKVYNEVVYWAQSRRPAYCVIRIGGGGGTQARVIPIEFFHAPSNAKAARWSTYISGLAREHYVIPDIDGNRRPSGTLTYHDKTIAAGDYNTAVSDPNRWNQDYASYHDPFGARWTAGADCTSLYTNANAANFRTTVQLRKVKNGRFTGDPITCDRLDAYYKTTIDEMFYRGLNGANSELWQLPADVMAGGSMIGPPVQGYAANLNTIRAHSLGPGGGGVDDDKGPLNAGGRPIFPFLTDWTTFYAGVQNGTLTSARSAAEFVREFVSDHFPLIVRFQV